MTQLLLLERETQRKVEINTTLDKILLLKLGLDQILADLFMCFEWRFPVLINWETRLRTCHNIINHTAYQQMNFYYEQI